MVHRSSANPTHGEFSRLKIIQSNKETKMTETTEQEAGTPGEFNITATSPKTGRECSFTRSLGATLAEATELFGEAAVLSGFHNLAVIRIQGAARTVLNNGEKSVEEAVAAGEGDVPGVQRRGGGGRKKKDPIAELAAAVEAGEASVEDIIAQLQSKLGEGGE